mmetsp:Transcript_98170/g.155278  ORF Transcript_98170/g.155278 Transcript_98170/m.155278 type:complete len:105 (+) Transcript_98170:250-564(+)
MSKLCHRPSGSKNTICKGIGFESEKPALPPSMVIKDFAGSKPSKRTERKCTKAKGAPSPGPTEKNNMELHRLSQAVSSPPARGGADGACTDARFARFAPGTLKA